MELKSLSETQELTQDQLDWLNKVVRGTWEYENGEVNVIGNVVINDITKPIPIQFGYVTEYFDCTNITSLKGSPREVGGSFWCNHTNITSLQYAPKEVGGDFYCYNTNITSLQYAPRVVGGDFVCRDTKIKGQPDTSNIQIGGELFWQ